MDNFEQFIVTSRYCKWLPEKAEERLGRKLLVDI